MQPLKQFHGRLLDLRAFAEAAQLVQRLKIGGDRGDGAGVLEPTLLHQRRSPRGEPQLHRRPRLTVGPLARGCIHHGRH
ncbi:MAG: hypothetical protein DCC67_04885 [Planctomycetota bacterium]|nr:MAG: hypothetical protein DCC67_04885 [Planctomycetota bacterium]